MPGGSSGVVIGQIVAAPAGDDLAPGAGEYVQLVNTGSAPVDLGNWTVEDDFFNFVRLPPGTIVPAGGSLLVHTGPGTSGAGHWFAGLSFELWDDGGDVVRVFRFDGLQVDGRRY